jgi:hypothetical protein
MASKWLLLAGVCAALASGCAVDDQFQYNVGTDQFHSFEEIPGGIRATGTVLRDEQVMLEFEPLPDATEISVVLEEADQQAAGDADLYARLDAPPTLESFTCRPYVEGSNEQCQVQAGLLYVAVRGYAEVSSFAVIVKGISTSP